MTSKSLFFKLMREDLKQKLWAVGLAFLSFFFSMPVLAAMRISELQERYEMWIANGTAFENGVTAEMRFQSLLMTAVKETVGPNNVLNICIIVAAALVMALTGFMYVHSKKQMDFFHSIPVRREMIFAAKYLNGILIILAMYLFNLFLAVGIFLMNGIEPSVLIPMALTASLIHLCGYLSIYGLMAVAVMLTGNFFVSILGGIVLFVYIPAVIALVQGLEGQFFVTYNGRNIDFDNLALNGSPMSFYIKMIGCYADSIEKIPEQLFRYAGAALAAGVILAAVTLFLYRIRPSESAGKAMAFKLTKAPINVMIVAPITIAMALTFWSAYNKLSWTVFGFVFGLIVTHCIVEIIYYFEFRKLFADLTQMAVSAVTALTVLCAFRYDVFGYDSFLPNENKLESASICVYNLEDWPGYGLPLKVEDEGFSWKYFQEDSYVAENMKIVDYPIIKALGEAGILQAKTAKAEMMSRTETSSDDSWSSVEIGYRLKNGKTVYRTYHINMTKNRDTIDQLYALKEYKMGVVPILSYEAKDVVGIYEARLGEIKKAELDENACAALLEAYQEEYTALTLDERVKEAPVTSLRFLTQGEREYLSDISLTRNPNYNGEFRISDMNNVNFFPVYPSFEKTIALLKQGGLDDFGPMKAEDVLRVEIYSDYGEYFEKDIEMESSYEGYQVYDRGGEMTVEETAAVAVAVEYPDERRTLVLENDDTAENLEKIQEVLDGSVDQELSYKNGLLPIDYGINIRVYRKKDNVGKTVAEQSFVSYVFPEETIPEFVKEWYHLDRVSSRNITHRLTRAAEQAE